jgi:hypothetical protein
VTVTNIGESTNNADTMRNINIIPCFSDIALQSLLTFQTSKVRSVLSLISYLIENMASARASVPLFSPTHSPYQLHSIYFVYAAW